MAELKPCPFCGGKAHTYTYNLHDKGMVRKMWLCKCASCWLNYPVRECCEQESEAIEAWNRRAEDGK